MTATAAYRSLCHACAGSSRPCKEHRRIGIRREESNRFVVIRAGRTVGFVDRMPSGSFRAYSFAKSMGLGPLSILAAARAALAR